ncbi:MAG: hypothetical protein PVJ40_06170 [Gammaproteobacteria bacterium]|jgi:hypothetical protein
MTTLLSARKLTAAAMLLLLGAALAACAPRRPESTLPPVRAKLNRLDYRPGELLVRFRENVTGATARTLIGEQHCIVKHADPDTGLYLVGLPKGLEVPEARRRFEALGQVRYAEPNFTRNRQ